MAAADVALAAARREALGLKGGVRDWLKKKPEAVKGDRELVLSLVQRDGLALEHASASLRGDREVVLAAVRRGAFALQYASQKLLTDRSFVLAAVQHNGYALACAPASFRGDRDVVLAAVREEGSALEYASEQLQADREVALCAARNSEPALEHVAPALWEDRAFAMATAEKNSAALGYFAPALQSDEALVLAVVTRNAEALRFIPQRMAAKDDFLLSALRGNAACLQFLPEALQEDHNFLLAAAASNSAVLEVLSEELWQDEAFVLAATAQDGASFRFASPSLRVRQDIVLQAVERSPSALEHAAPKLRQDTAFLLQAIKQSSAALQHTPPNLQQDPKFVLDAIQRNSSATQHVPDALWSNPEFVLGAAELEPSNFEFARELRGDKGFVMNLVSRQGMCLEFAAESLRRDREVLEKALSSDLRALGKADEQLRGDRAIVQPVIEARGSALQYATDALKADHELVLAAVCDDGEALAFAAPALREDRDFVLRAVEEDGAAFAHAAQKLRSDRAFVLQAVAKQGHALQFADERLLLDEDFLLAAVRQNAAALGYVPAGQRASHGFVLAAVRTNAAALRFAPRRLQDDPAFLRASKNGYVEVHSSVEAGGEDSASSLEDLYDFCELDELQDDGSPADEVPDTVLGHPGKAMPEEKEEEDLGGGGLFDFGELDELQRFADAFAGSWEDGDGVVITIQGTALHGPGGTIDLEIRSCDTIACDLGSGECEATLEEDGTLRWSDGCTWRRLQDSQPGSAPELEGLSPAELRKRYRRLGLPPEPGLGADTRLARLQMAATWAKCPLLELVRTCREAHVPTRGVSELPSEERQRELLVRRLLTRECVAGWEAGGIPVRRLARVADAARLARRLARLERMRVVDLEAEHRRLGLPLDKVMQRRELEEPLRKVRLWERLPLRELQRECEEQGLSTRDLGTLPHTFEEDRRQKLLARLIRTLSSDALDGRGIPLQRLPSVEVGIRVSEEWDRLDRLSTKGLLDDCAGLGLPAQDGLDWCGRGDLVARLRLHILWQEFSIEELRSECSKRQVACDRPQAAHAEGQRLELLESLLVDLFADLYEEGHGGLPVRQLGSLRAATAVLDSWQRLAKLGTAGLQLEFKQLLGVFPDEAMQMEELLRRLRQAAVWAQQPLRGLRAECTKRAMPAHLVEGDAKEREVLTQRLLQTICSDVYSRRGVDLKIYGSIATASSLLDRWDELDRLSQKEVALEYQKLGLPAPPRGSHVDLKERLRRLARWQAMPFRALQDECWGLGLRAGRNMGFFSTPGQQEDQQGSQASLYYRSFSELNGDRGRLVREIVAAVWENVSQSEEQAQPPPADEQQPGESEGGPPEPEQSWRRPPPPRPPRVLEHLRTLGLPEDACLEDVKKAYRQLALKHHPDKNPDVHRESATQLFQELGEAYEALLVFLRDS